MYAGRGRAYAVCWFAALPARRPVVADSTRTLDYFLGFQESGLAGSGRTVEHRLVFFFFDNQYANIT